MVSRRKHKKHLPEQLRWPKKLKKNISMKNKINNNPTSFESHLDEQYGVRGTKLSEEYEQGFEVFKLGVLIQEMREKNNLTQEQLADKCGTTKSYISRIENNASDIRLSTLIRIIRQGFGGSLRLSVDMI